jgi:hypothetical protein
LTGIGGTVEVLFPGVESVVPAGGLTVAVLAAMVLGVVVGAVPVTVMVNLLVAPATIDPVKLIALPLPLATLQLALPAATQAHVTPVNCAGTVSLIVAPATSEGPALVTTI